MLAEYGVSDQTRPMPIDSRMLIVAVSAHAMAGDRERFIQTGMNYYISKPIIMHELAQVLAQINALRGIANFRGE
jgi:CheY-like chemotaxis protein